MHIETIPVKIAGDPFFTTNCYIVSASEEATCAFVIDPGDEPEVILQHVGNRTLAAVIITHGHYDHIGGVATLAQETGAKIYAHADDAALLKESYDIIKEGYVRFAQQRNLETPDEETHAPHIDYPLAEGDVLDLCSVELQVIHTPGHSQGSVCLYNAKDHVLFSGDTLFKGTCGRTDFVGSSPQSMHESLLRLSDLPPDTTVYPGHDAKTTIGEERNRGLKAC